MSLPKHWFLSPTSQLRRYHFRLVSHELWRREHNGSLHGVRCYAGRRINPHLFVHNQQQSGGARQIALWLGSCDCPESIRTLGSGLSDSSDRSGFGNMCNLSCACSPGLILTIVLLLLSSTLVILSGSGFRAGRFSNSATSPSRARYKSPNP